MAGDGVTEVNRARRAERAKGVGRARPHKAFKVFSILGWILSMLMLLLCICMAVIAIGQTIGEGNLSFGAVRVVSGSMEPTIRTGAMCWVVPTDMDSVEVGDIVVYWSYNRGDFIIHRVIEKTETEDGEPAVITKGDHNEVADGIPVTSDMLKSKVVSIWNWFASIAGSSTGKSEAAARFRPIMLVAVILAICVMVYEQGAELVETVKESREHRDELPEGSEEAESSQEEIKQEDEGSSGQE